MECLPLDEFQLTSSYGRRIDPFNGRFAMHAGIDLANQRRAPVHVTPPRVVTFMDWKGGFGKIGPDGILGKEEIMLIQLHAQAAAAKIRACNTSQRRTCPGFG